MCCVLAVVSTHQSNDGNPVESDCFILSYGEEVDKAHIRLSDIKEKQDSFQLSFPIFNSSRTAEMEHQRVLPPAKRALQQLSFSGPFVTPSTSSTQKIFTVAERKASNVNGALGKCKLDPEKIKYIKSVTFHMYPLSSNESEAVEWGNSVNVIDEANRRLNTTKSKKSKKK